MADRLLIPKKKRPKSKSKWMNGFVIPTRRTEATIQEQDRIARYLDIKIKNVKRSMTK